MPRAVHQGPRPRDLQSPLYPRYIFLHTGLSRQKGTIKRNYCYHYFLIIIYTKVDTFIIIHFLYCLIFFRSSILVDVITKLIQSESQQIKLVVCV